MDKPKRKGPGRPKNARTDLVAFNAQMTPEAKERLQVLAQIQKAPAYAVLEDAFWHRWRTMPASQRQRAETVLSLLNPEAVETPSED